MKLTLILFTLIGICVGSYRPLQRHWQERQRPEWRTAEVEQGDIVAVVNATGQVKPVKSVEVGAFVSGPITDLPVEFNDEVTDGQLLAKIDPRLYEAAVKRDKAILLARQSDKVRVQALLQQAIRDEDRAKRLLERDEDFISQAELDQLRYKVEALEAELAAADAAITQAEASLENSETNVEYTSIVSPVDGIIIDRRIEPGQTLASTFQTPQLFIVAPGLRERIHVHASVDEADIGLILDAKKRGMPVYFTVDAYPDDLFQGEIEEVRYSSTSVQNVVTYPVIVGAPNPELKLLPGMTASISFRVDDRTQVLKIPNSALRFYPDIQYVREQDKTLLEGNADDEDDEGPDSDLPLSAEERARMRQERRQRHVWVLEEHVVGQPDRLRAIEVEVGLNDSRFTELVGGALEQGQALVTGMRAKGPFGG